MLLIFFYLKKNHINRNNGRQIPSPFTLRRRPAHYNTGRKICTLHVQPVIGLMSNWWTENKLYKNKISHNDPNELYTDGEK